VIRSLSGGDADNKSYAYCVLLVENNMAFDQKHIHSWRRRHRDLSPGRGCQSEQSRADAWSGQHCDCGSQMSEMAAFKQCRALLVDVDGVGVGVALATAKGSCH
jgi:hypothetical protein